MKNAWALLAACVFLAEVFAPLVGATHDTPAFDDVSPISGPLALPLPSGTGESRIDDVLRDVYARQNESIADLNAQMRTLYNASHDLAQGRVLEDHAGADGRIGGFGDWLRLGGSAWKPSTSANWRGEWGFAFGDESGRYPRQFNDEYFVSPAIDLTAVLVPPAQGEPQLPSQVGLVFTRTGTEPPPVDMPSQKKTLLENPAVDPILLTMVHRLNLYAGTDGARIEVLEQEPTPGERPAKAIVLLPVPFQANASDPQATTPTYARDVGQFRADASSGYNQNKIADGSAFTGTFDWNVSVFDLTPFAGQKIWIALHVRTGFGSVQEDPVHFARKDFYGWNVDDVRVSAPALPQRLRLTSLDAAPARRTETESIVPPGEPVAVNATIHNAGSLPTNATLRVDFLDEAGTLKEQNVTSLALEGGDVQNVTVPVRLSDAAFRRVVASLSYETGAGAADDADRVAEIHVRAAILNDFVVTTELEEDLVAPGESARFWANVTNGGNVARDVVLVVGAASLEGSDSAPAAILDGPESIARRLLPGEQAHLSWDARPVLAGRYLLGAHLTDAQETTWVLASAKTALNVGLGPRVTFLSDFEQADPNWTNDPPDVPAPWIPGHDVWGVDHEGQGALTVVSPASADPVAWAEAEEGKGFTLDFTFFVAQEGSVTIEATYPFNRSEVAPPGLNPIDPSLPAAGVFTSNAFSTSSWHSVRLQLDEFLSNATGGTRAAWNPALVGIQFRGKDAFLQEFKLTYSPGDRPDREIVFAYDGKTKMGIVKTKPSAGTDWKEWKPSELDALRASAASWARSDRNPKDPQVWNWGTGEPGRLVSPEITLTDAAQPLLLVEHRYATLVQLPSGFYSGEVHQNAIVQVQVKRPDGLWGPWRTLVPADGFPTHAELGNTNGAGAGFFAPSGVTYTSNGARRTDHTGSGWETSAFDLSSASDVNPDLRGETIRLGFFLTKPKTILGTIPVDEDRGWWVRSVAVLPAPRLVNDGAIDSVTLDVPYDYESLGVPPDAEVPVKVLLRNAGRLGLGRVNVSLHVETDGEEIVVKKCVESLEPERCVVSLGAAESKNVTFAWTPSGPLGTTYTIEAKYEPVSVRDENPANDNRTLGDRLALPLTRVEDAAVRVGVTPRDGGPEPRVVRILVANLGNVPLHGLQVERKVYAEGQLASQTQWTLDGPIKPDGQWRSMLDASLGAKDAQGEAATFSKDFVWTPRTAGRYATVATVRAAGEPTVFDQQSADFLAQDVFFADDLDSGRRGAVGAWDQASLAGSWAVVDSSTTQGKLFRFGDPASGFAGGSQANLTTPVINLSTAVHATLTFRTNYSFEPEFDAGRVEASTDGGRTWVPLDPQPTAFLPEGYPAAVAASNPLNLAHDPTVDVRALTRASLDLSPAAREANGTVPVAFDLGQIPAFRETSAVADLALEAPGADVSLALGSARSFTSPTWQPSIGLGPWVVENLTYRSPEGIEGAWFAWSNASGGSDEFRIRVPLDALANPEQAPRLEFWDWREGVSEHDRNGIRSYSIYVCDADSTRCDAPRVYSSLDRQGTVQQSGAVEMISTAGDWTRWGIDLDKAAKEIPQCPCEEMGVRFVYTGQGSGTYGRGWALGPARVATAAGETIEKVFDPADPSDPAYATAIRWSRARSASTSVSGFVPGLVEGKSGWSWQPPPNDPVDARLVTPEIDLASFAGGSGTLAFNTTLDTAHGAQAAVEIQVFDPVTKAWGPWRTLFRSATPPFSSTIDFDLDRGLLPSEEKNATGYGNATLWAPSTFEHFHRKVLQSGELRMTDVVYVLPPMADPTRLEFDLTPFAGERVRLAFHAAQAGPDQELCPAEGCWRVWDVAVLGTVFRGGPVQLRFHAATDGSVNAGFWDVDDVTVSGARHTRNLRLQMSANLTRTAAEAPVTIHARVDNLGAGAPPETLALHLQSDAAFDAPGAIESALGPLLPLGKPKPWGIEGSFAVAFADPGAHVLRATLVALDAEGAPHPIASEVDGFRSASVALDVVEPTHALLLEMEAPAQARAATETAVRLVLRDEGTFAQNGTWDLVATRDGGASTDCARGKEFALEPGNATELRAACVLTAQGRYLLTATATSGPATAQATRAIYVDPEIVAFEDGFERGSDWAQAPTDPRDSRPIEAPSNKHGSAANSGVSEWRATTGESHSGATSWQFGPEADEFARGKRYGDFQDASLVSPILDLTQMEGDTAFLSFWHRPDFSEGDGGVVEAGIESGVTTQWVRLEPEGGYPGKTSSIGFLVAQVSGGDSRVCAPCYRNPLGATPAFTGRSDEWEHAVIDLAKAGLAGKTFQVRFRVGTMEASPAPWSPAVGQGWFIDDVAVVASVLLVEPRSVEIHQADGSTKTQYLKVSNAGGFDLPIDVALDEDHSSAEATQIFSLARVPDAVPGNRSDLAVVRVDSPVAQAGFSSEQSASFRVAASVPAALSQDARIQLFLSKVPHPHLVARIESSDGDALETSVPHPLTVVVENRGAIDSRPARIDLVARFVQTGDEMLVGTAELPALRAQGVEPSLSHFVWTPLGAVGPYVLEARVDPEGVNVNENPLDRVAELDVDVVPLYRPDLEVISLDATTSAGEPLSSATEGDLVAFVGTVINSGTADAPEVTLRLSVDGSVAKIQRLPRLKAGEATTILVNQFVKAGEVSYDLAAVTSVVETSPGNNRLTRALDVSGGDVRWTTDAATAIVLPLRGEREVGLEIENALNATMAYRLEVEAPSAIRAEASSPLVTVPAHGRERVTLNASALPGATAGGYDITVRATPVGPGLPALWRGHVLVPVQQRIELRPLSASSPLDAFALDVRNRGNAKSELSLALEGPVESEPLSVSIAQGESLVVTPRLAPSLDVPPGERSATVLVRQGPDVVASTRATIRIPVVQAIELLPSAADPALLRVQSRSNVPIVVEIDAGRLPAGWSVAFDPPVLRLSPGESAQARIVIEGSPDANDTTLRLSPTVRIPGTNVSATFDATVPNPNAGLRIADVSYHDGEIVAVVENAGGRATSPLTVAFYVDGSLIHVARVGSVAKGAAATASAPWERGAGPHGVVVTISTSEGSVSGKLSRALSISGDDGAGIPAIQQVPGVPLLGAIAALAALAVALRPRRRA